MLAQVVLTLGWDGTRLGCILSSIAFAGWWPKTIFIVMYGMVIFVGFPPLPCYPSYAITVSRSALPVLSWATAKVD